MLPKRWLEHWVRPVILTMMIGAIGLSMVTLMQLFVKGWNGTYLIVVLMLVTLESYYSYYVIKRLELRGAEHLRLRVVELVTFLILLKAGRLLSQSWTDAWAEISSWAIKPGNIFADPELLAGFFLVLIIWGLATQTATDLDTIDRPLGLNLEDDSIKARHQDRLDYQLAAENNQRAMNNLRGSFLRGGAFLLVLAGISQIGFMELLNFSRPPVQGLMLNVLFYFISGLIMLGLVRYASLRRRWEVQRITISGDLSARWISYIVSLVSLALFFAFILPAGDWLNLLSTTQGLLGVALQWLTFLVLALVFIITFPFLWFFSLITSLFASDNQSFTAPPPAPPLPPPAALPPGTAPAWYEIMRTLLFWAVILGMLYFILRTYLYDHPELIQSLKSMRPVRLLRLVWQRIWGYLLTWLDAAKAHLPRHLPRIGTRLVPTAAPRAFFKFGSLSARQKVLYYYRNILLRAGKQGIPRQDAETPYEYHHSLERKLPRAQNDLAHLTETFVEARYSQHDITAGEVEQAKGEWEALKKTLEEVSSTDYKASDNRQS